MPTYPEWDRTALEIAWEDMDYHSMHYYAGNQENDTASYLASACVIRALCRYTGRDSALCESQAAHRNMMCILSWDEWQVWYKGDPVHGELG